jgi:hypothetical protein
MDRTAKHQELIKQYQSAMQTARALHLELADEIRALHAELLPGWRTEVSAEASGVIRQKVWRNNNLD